MDTLWLLTEVIGSFHTDGKPGVGLPLSNLTSQLLVNIYMNVFDHFMKRNLKAMHYIRYADDFVVLHERREYLEHLLPQIAAFLESQLRLTLHPNKVTIATIASGVDFLGCVHFPNHRVLRTTTKRRMMKNLSTSNKEGSTTSYLGILKHGNAHGLSKIIQSKHYALV